MEVTLRQIENNSGNNRKNAYKIEIDAFYTSFNWLITPIVDKSSKAKDNKARLDTVRITQLKGTPEAKDTSTSDTKMEDKELDS